MEFKNASGLQALLKEGSRHYSGNEEATFRNIGACKEISRMTRTSLGPHGKRELSPGMNKMVINQLEKQFVTSDAATIVNEMEVHHPAARMVVMAAKMQEEEIGDGTNFVIIFASELLSQAEFLLQQGLNVSDILHGYDIASNKSLEILQQIGCFTLENIRDKAELTKCLKPVVAAKHYGQVMSEIRYEDTIAPLITEACLHAMPENSKKFNVDNVRVAKVLGGSIDDSSVIHGLILQRRCETSRHKVIEAKVACYQEDFQLQNSDTKGKVLVKKASELENYTKSEEDHLEEIIKSIADKGIECVVLGGSVSDVALHYLEKYNMMAIKVLSKFDFKRVVKSLGAEPMVRMSAPTPEEIGYADCIEQLEIGSNKVVVFRRDEEENRVATILLRGSTHSLLEDAGRAIDDGVNLIRTVAKKPKFVAGAGATQIHLASQIQTFAKTHSGLEQYAIEKFGQAFEIIPRTLAENAGQNAEQVIAKLFSETAKSPFFGIDIESQGILKDMKESEIFDLMEGKIWGIRLATDVVNTILNIDQIIMAKPAGGPKPRAARAPDLD